MLTDADIRAFCVALAFVAMIGKWKKKNGAAQIMNFAEIVEQFCRLNVPEAFEEETPTDTKTANLQGAKESFETTERMTSVIVEIIRKRGACESVDLLEHGFSHAEIERCWPMAIGLAKVELNWMN
jgi:hypothetical protein